MVLECNVEFEEIKSIIQDALDNNLKEKLADPMAEVPDLYGQTGAFYRGKKQAFEEVLKIIKSIEDTKKRYG